MFSRVVAALAAAILLPAVVGAQARDLTERVDGATFALVSPILAAAALDSLPVTALESKILEGVTKARPAQQIARVVADLAEDFRVARVALREAFPERALTEGEVVAVAFARRQGVSIQVVAALGGAVAVERSLEVPLTVLSELLRKGIPVADASMVMEHVVRAAVPVHVAAQIPGRVDGALSSGSPPAAALLEALRVLEIPAPAGRGPNE